MRWITCKFISLTHCVPKGLLKPINKLVKYTPPSKYSKATREYVETTYKKNANIRAYNDIMKEYGLKRKAVCEMCSCIMDKHSLNGICQDCKRIVFPTEEEFLSYVRRFKDDKTLKNQLIQKIDISEGF